MAGFIYFVPERTRGKAVSRLSELKIAHAFEGEPTMNEATSGPGGSDGLVLADQRSVDPGRVGYSQANQTWRQIPGSAAWVGYYNSDPPVPANLERKSMLRGRFILLADECEWLCPIARGLLEEDNQLRWYIALPCVTGVDAEGRWFEGSVASKYAGLWDHALKYWEALWGAEASKGRIEFSFEAANDIAAAALQANYRIAKVEIGMLGLFTSATVKEVLLALVDWHTFQEIAKKKAGAAGSSSAGGPAEETAATARPS